LAKVAKRTQVRGAQDCIWITTDMAMIAICLQKWSNNLKLRTFPGGGVASLNASSPASEVDEIDLLILELLVGNPGTNYKTLAKSLNIDQRTVSRRVKALMDRGILKNSVVVDWAKLGFHAQAYVGSTTARGIDYARKLGELVRTDPRIVEAYETLGSFQYFMTIIETDTFKMRDSVLRDLDVLAAELTTTLVTNTLKQDYASLIRYLRETKFPRTRTRESLVP
jgi:DNA-binding Lrp family transcriptional regulator